MEHYCITLRNNGILNFHIADKGRLLFEIAQYLSMRQNDALYKFVRGSGLFASSVFPWGGLLGVERARRSIDSLERGFFFYQFSSTL